MTLGAFPVYADSAASAPELGPVTSKDVVYQIITDRFYDGDTSNNVPAGFDATLYDGTGQDLKLYQGGDWAGIIEKIPYLKGMGVTAVWISAPYGSCLGKGLGVPFADASPFYKTLPRAAAPATTSFHGGTLLPVSRKYHAHHHKRRTESL